jgi:hypothetical protein
LTNSQLFIRTPQGLSNQAQFLGVDAVVFTESGPLSFNLSEIESGAQNEESMDCLFWRNVIGSFAATKRLHMKPIGSKNATKAVANLVSNGTVSHVLVAMDRDFDHLRNSLIIHPNVLYTLGYSWENDIWTINAMNELFRVLAVDQTQVTTASLSISDFFRKLEKTYEMTVRFDHALSLAGGNPLQRSCLEDTVRISPDNQPQLLRQDLATLLKNMRTARPLVKPSPKNAVRVTTDLHGHTLEKACLGLVRHLLQRLGKQKVNNSALRCLAINFFRSAHPNGLIAPYSGIVSKIIW